MATVNVSEEELKILMLYRYRNYGNPYMGMPMKIPVPPGSGSCSNSSGQGSPDLGSPPLPVDDISMGLSNVIRSSYTSGTGLAEELERLFIGADQERILGQENYPVEHVHDFDRNGVDTDLDYLDRLAQSNEMKLKRPTRAEELLAHGQAREGLLMVLSRAQHKKTQASIGNKKNVCVFCKTNGETEMIYSSHVLKDKSGRVLCPILRAYNCPNCGAHGDVAHTLKYCPLTPANTEQKRLGGRRPLFNL